MKLILKVLGGLVVLIVVVIAGVLVAARFNDGPLAIIAGGPFNSGEKYTGSEPDWSYLRDMQIVEFQSLNPVRSRTTWIAEVDGKIYIPSGYMTTTWGKIWKQWPIEAEADGRIILRVQCKLYDRTMVRIKEGPEIEPVLAELSRKYAGGAEFPSDIVSSGYMWLFELAPRG